MTPPTRILIVEDDPRALKAMVKLLGAVADFRVVDAVQSGELALSRLVDPWPAGPPNVVLMDLELPGIGGVETTRRLLEQASAMRPRLEIDVLVWTSFADEDHVFEAMRAGAAGYLVKGAPRERLVRAIGEIAAGGTVLEPRLARRFWDYFRGLDRGAPVPMVLSSEELEILQLVAKGLSNAQVGEAIGAGRRSVRTVLTRIYDKLGARSHVEAVVIAVRRGWVRV